MILTEEFKEINRKFIKTNNIIRIFCERFRIPTILAEKFFMNIRICDLCNYFLYPKEYSSEEFNKAFDNLIFLDLSIIDENDILEIEELKKDLKFFNIMEEDFFSKMDEKTYKVKHIIFKIENIDFFNNLDHEEFSKEIIMIFEYINKKLLEKEKQELENGQ